MPSLGYRRQWWCFLHLYLAFPTQQALRDRVCCMGLGWPSQSRLQGNTIKSVLRESLALCINAYWSKIAFKENIVPKSTWNQYDVSLLYSDLHAMRNHFYSSSSIHSSLPIWHIASAGKWQLLLTTTSNNLIWPLVVTPSQRLWLGGNWLVIIMKAD